MKDKRTTSMGIAIMVIAFALGIISALGIMPFLAAKAALLHFPALIISIFLAGIGLALITGVSGKPPNSTPPQAEPTKPEL